MLKQILKSGVQSFAARYGPHTRRHSTPRLLILMYHRILPENDARIVYEEPGMTVTPTTFEMHLGVLAEYFEFINLAEWIDRKQQGRALPQMACAITFDDGWRDNYEFAFPALEKKHIPATIFVASSLIDSFKLFWPERLSRIAYAISEKSPERWHDPELAWLQVSGTDFTDANIPPTREQLSLIIASAKQHSDHVIHQKLDRVEESLNLHIQPEQPSLLTWEQIQKMINSGLVDIGSHTCNHTRLNNNTPYDIIKDEIVSSKHKIETCTGLTARTFCFPNGDYSAEALNLIRQNYEGAVTTARGWNTDNTNNYMLHRIGVHENSAKDKISFLAKISGWI